MMKQRENGLSSQIDLDVNYESITKNCITPGNLPEEFGVRVCHL